MGLLDDLKNYSASDMLPLHMPGHKRKSAFSGILPYEWDITEIEGFDNLHAPDGTLADLSRRLAALWGADHAYALINGSTCGILAGIRTLTRPGGKILLPRGCHQSVWHAIELCDLDPVCLPTRLDPDFGLPLPPTPEQVEKALSDHPEIVLTLIPSPTYEGICADLSGIAEAVHRRGGLLMVDQAHGAHFGFSPPFPPSAVGQGADLTVISMHKTLPCMTQTAAALLSDRLGDEIRREFARNLAIFETSSPSYILLASIDQCVELLERKKSWLFDGYTASLIAFGQRIQRLTRLRVPGYTTPRPKGAFVFDPGKIVVSTRFSSISGIELAAILRKEYLIETEMSTPGYLLAMTSVADSAADLIRFGKALTEIDATLSPADPPPVKETLPLPRAVLRLSEAVRLPARPVAVERAVGKICADTVRAYPPGIPLILPGETVSREIADEIVALAAAGATVLTKNGKFSGEIFIKAENTD